MARTRLDRSKPAADTFEREQPRPMRTRIGADADADDASDENSFRPSRSIRRRAEDAGTQDSRALVDADLNSWNSHAGMGRPKGASNRLSRVLKEAIVLAAEEVGEDGSGRDGLKGYLRRLAIHEAPAFASLLKRIMPQTIRADGSLAVQVLAQVRGLEPDTLNGQAHKVIEHRPPHEVDG